MPGRLADPPAADPTASVQERSFRLAGHAINGRRMDMSRMDATVAPGSREVWQVVNGDGAPHSFHVHGVSFRLLTADGRTPPPELAGWKDTLFLRPDVRYEIVVDMPRFADPHVPYMFHCHVLEPEDRGMMGQFLVVDSAVDSVVDSVVDPGGSPHGTHT